MKRHSEFRAALSEWSAYHEVIAGVLDFVRQRGIYAGAGPDLAVTCSMLSYHSLKTPPPTNSVQESGREHDMRDAHRGLFEGPCLNMP